MVKGTNIPKGYKQTEVGVIPEDWEVTLLGEKTIKVGSGITPTGGEKVYKREGRPFLRSQNIGWGSLLLEDIAFIDDEIHNTFKSTEINKNDVFLNITGASIGRSAVADERVENGNVNQHVCIIRTIKKELSPNFLNYFLLSRNGQKQIDSFQAGGNRQGINFGQIKSFQIPLPPLPEQQAIAGALSDVDALLTSLEQLIAKKRNLKQGAMQQLLTGKKRLPGFTGEWEVKKLGEIADVKDGTHQTPKYVDYGIPFYSVENVTINDFKNTKFISEQEHTFLTKSFRIEKGDILMTRIGSIGECKLIDWDVNASFYVSLALLKIKRHTSSSFLLHYTKGADFKKQAELKSLQWAIPKKINLGEISEIKITIPPAIAEQTAIAEILSDMDQEIEALEQKKEKYKALKQGMMQELLTGKTRLI